MTLRNLIRRESILIFFCFVDYPPFHKILSFLSRNISKSISILEKKRSFDELKSVCEVPYFILKYILLYPIWCFCDLFKGGKYQSFQVRDNALGVVHRKEVIYPLVKGFLKKWNSLYLSIVILI